ncbi:hypothetical protein FEM48_Zijuj09G0229300 [Ziziphus jujuba var. spinosa]|uniref:Bifunctional inhibitor/plant lipid transfer protein/seed storage helical domain-containing protein n=1 Tax=Ziziphus jujuba var. spinosa TaxID=714518 RepID=A0A978UVT2_ZIZJJ|nr:hypothetical protein FEM48_Zijuj09G0229300 [Ziziphus jujuba var. spinosa]
MENILKMKQSMAMLIYGAGIIVLALGMLSAIVGADKNNNNNNNNNNNSCMNELAPCLNYLNGNREPPESCCDPLKSIIKNNPKCLCSMITNQGSRQAEQAGINITEAQTLPGRCGQHVNPLSCLKAASPSPSSGSNNKNSNTNSRPNNNNENSGSSSTVSHHVLGCWMNIAAAVVSLCVFRYYF